LGLERIAVFAFLTQRGLVPDAAGHVAGCSVKAAARLGGCLVIEHLPWDVRWAKTKADLIKIG
jgi:hypothetical protein